MWCEWKWKLWECKEVTILWLSTTSVRSSSEQTDSGLRLCSNESFCPRSIFSESVSSGGTWTGPQMDSRVPRQKFTLFPSVDESQVQVSPNCENHHGVCWQTAYFYCTLHKTVPYHNCVFMTECLWLFTETWAAKETQTRQLVLTEYEIDVNKMPAEDCEMHGAHKIWGKFSDHMSLCNDLDYCDVSDVPGIPSEEAFPPQTLFWSTLLLYDIMGHTEISSEMSPGEQEVMCNVCSRDQRPEPAGNSAPKSSALTQSQTKTHKFVGLFSSLDANMKHHVAAESTKCYSDSSFPRHFGSAWFSFLLGVCLMSFTFFNVQNIHYFHNAVQHYLSQYV